MFSFTISLHYVNFLCLYATSVEIRNISFLKMLTYTGVHNPTRTSMGMITLSICFITHEHHSNIIITFYQCFQIPNNRNDYVSRTYLNIPWISDLHIVATHKQINILSYRFCIYKKTKESFRLRKFYGAKTYTCMSTFIT